MDAVFVIAIRGDTARHEKIHQRWSALNPELFLVDRHRDPKQGCFESHMKVLETAKRRGLRRVLVLESDAYPLQDVEEIAAGAVSRVEFLDATDPGWKHVLLGYFPVRSQATEVPDLVKVKCAFLSHAYVVNVENADTFPDWNDVQVDNVMFCNASDPAQSRRDAYLSYESGTYGAVPMSVIQDVTLPSTIDQSHVDLQEKILHRVGQDNMAAAAKYVNVLDVIPLVVSALIFLLVLQFVPETFRGAVAALMVIWLVLAVARMTD